MTCWKEALISHVLGRARAVPQCMRRKGSHSVGDAALSAQSGCPRWVFWDEADMQAVGGQTMLVAAGGVLSWGDDVTSVRDKHGL